MRSLGLVFGIAALALVIFAHDTAAQTAPGGPSITTVSPRDGELKIAWSAPASDGGIAITRYDVRHIDSNTSPPDKNIAANWISALAWSSGDGAFENTITNLANGTSYDVQVRAAHSHEGNWSATRVGVPNIQNGDPEFTGTTYTRTASENLAIGANVGAPVTAADPDRDVLTYTIAPAGSDRFVIDSRTGQLRLRRFLDAEISTNHELTIQVTDSKDRNGDPDPTNDATVTVNITVTDVDEGPRILGERWESHPEDDTGVIATYQATDPEGETVTWSALAGPDARHFALTGGALSFFPGVDYEAPADADRDNRYLVTVVAVDDDGDHGTLDVTVFVYNVDEAPVIKGPASVSVRELGTRDVATYTLTDPEGQTVLWSSASGGSALGGTDGEDFDFSEGRLRFKKAPRHSPIFRQDEDLDNVYEVTLRATDGAQTATLDLTITVTNVAENGTLNWIDLRQPYVDRSANASLNDWDDPTIVNWGWERSLNPGGPWTAIAGADEKTYTPVADDVNYYLRVTIVYDDDFRNAQRLQRVTEFPVKAAEPTNQLPTWTGVTIANPLFTISEDIAPGTVIGIVPAAIDPEGDPLIYSVTGGEGIFTIYPLTRELRTSPDFVGSIDAESSLAIAFLIEAFDRHNMGSDVQVVIAVTSVDEPPIIFDDHAAATEDTAIDIDVLSNDEGDPEKDGNDTLTIGSGPRHGTATMDGDEITYTPNTNYHGADFFTYGLTDANGNSSAATVRIIIARANDAPVFATNAATLSVSEQALPGHPIGDPITATDIDGDALTYSASGRPAAFLLDADTGQISVSPTAVLDSAAQSVYTFTLTASDAVAATASIVVTINVTSEPLPAARVRRSGGGGGGGGGGSSRPSPSTADFSWTVDQDLATLTADHGFPTGLWGDGTTLWITEDGAGGDDALYAYQLDTGKRDIGREFALADTNRSPRGLYSDGETMWVSDSDRDRLFAYVLATGDRDRQCEFELGERNSDARGTWSDGKTIWVVDGGNDAIFAYELATGALLGEYTLAEDNDDPHGIWSDGVGFWVSDHAGQRIFAYRQPAAPTQSADAVATALVRVRTDDFSTLARAGNRAPRGIWSDGALMYVVDQGARRVYTYNMPDANDARLLDLTLDRVLIGNFSPNRLVYRGSPTADTTTVRARPAQANATVAIIPADVDTASGHQVALAGSTEISVRVISPNGTRSRTYHVMVSSSGCSAAIERCQASLALRARMEITDNLYHDLAPANPNLHHNISNLKVTVNGGVHRANFLDFFNRTGAVLRWGYPVSEVVEIEPGTLSQFYQRGVIDFHDVGSGYLVERRLTWDYVAGGRGGSVDQGVEPAPAIAPVGGIQVGAFGHYVANVDAGDKRTGFLDFFNALGGVDAFGFPKTGAREDTGAADMLLDPGSVPGFARQYFQAAVFQLNEAGGVELTLLGDTLRDLLVPGYADEDAFAKAEALAVGQAIFPPLIIS